MQGKWQIQTAKNKFSEVINCAMTGKPQMITKNGKPAVYVISIKDYEAITKKKDIKKLLMTSPHKDLDIKLQRQIDTGREISI